jgi:ATP-dependent Clp protease adaptor protein ClpS
MPQRRPGEANEVGVVTKTRPTEALKRPPLFKVLLLNDDYTTMEFVVWVLQTVFHHDEATATGIMLHVHRTGYGVAGVYPRDIAETRSARVEALAREHEFPLQCRVEADDEPCA